MSRRCQMLTKHMKHERSACRFRRLQSQMKTHYTGAMTSVLVVKLMKRQNSGQCVKTGRARASQEPCGSLASLIQCQMVVNNWKINMQVPTFSKPMQQLRFRRHIHYGGKTYETSILRTLRIITCDLKQASRR